MRDRDRNTAPPRARTRLKKLRLLVILGPLALLAAVSTAFGMMMAVASDLPALENEPAYRTSADTRNSILVDAHGETIGRLVSEKNRVFVKYDDIAPAMRSAIVAVEDERYATNNGVDLRGIARAFTQDIVQQRAAQGGSTITQQFVKNALEAQSQRTVFQKVRESALAYHLTRRWGKKKILQEYLNSIYFGNGAYGIEAAAETYFGQEPDLAAVGCGKPTRPPCASLLRPWEAAFLAGIVASPSGFDPVTNPRDSTARRAVVLKKMLDQGYIDREQYETSLAKPMPDTPRAPTLDAKLGSEYFVSWVRQQLVDRYGAQRAFEGGLKVRTTLDLELQQAAEVAVRNYLPGPNGPTASLVAIDNDSGEVRAMVSGTKEFTDAPFNLATQGQRQPGSVFKPFILAEALKQGVGPGKVYPSRKRYFCVTKNKSGKGCRETFEVNNFESTYVGQRTLGNALTYSDNSVYAAAGIELGTKKVARLAERMGIRSPVSSNLAMTLGGLKQGVTPLDMAHAYETFATGGKRVTGSLGSSENGPVGITRVLGKNGDPIKDGVNKTNRIDVLSQGQAEQATAVMSTVVQQGTGKRAAFGEFAAGKTGTTENSGDAWFVGFTDRLTVAVWVGYPDELKPMETEFRGGPVEGGTFPALIWRDFQIAANASIDKRAAADRERRGLPPVGASGTSGASGSSEPLPTPSAEGDVVPEGGGTGDGGKPDGAGAPDGTGGGQQPKPAAPEAGGNATPAPAPNPTPATPAPATPPAQSATPPATPPASGTGGGVAAP
ncbi:MAG: transglycosylase domain-containing protein, partial [Solirubrobacterales bacterium]|nr:transglycosylase domain-containing protein [Solirubrobacterales bacterium]